MGASLYGKSKTKHLSVAAFKITGRRSVAISTVNAPTPPANQIAYCDIDNHADTTVVVAIVIRNSSLGR